MSQQPGRPNVVVVLTDQQRWDSTGVHGNPLGLTPEFDRLATHGTHVAQAFAANPVCAPSRAALQTGRYGTASGVFRNALPLPAGTRTLADHFGAAGYRTGYIGKWHLAGAEPVPPEQRGGYRSWLGANLLEFSSDDHRTVVFDDDGVPVLLPGYRSDALVDAAIRFVGDCAGVPRSLGGPAARDPFFLFLSLIEPHHQNEVDAYPAPEGYEARYQGRWVPPDLAALSGAGSTAHQHLGGYWGQIRRVDEGLGRLLDALRSLDLLDDTIVAFTSDHGCHFKTRNGEYKRSCHDASIRVPLALRGPGFDGGGRVSRPVSGVDLAPTLLDAAGLPVPDTMQGRSFLPLLRDPGAVASWPDDVFVQVSESEVGRVLRTSRWKYYVVAPDADPWHDAAAGRYVEAALHDLTHDPYELVNLAGAESHSGVAAELRRRLAERMVAAGEAEPVIDPAPPAPLAVQRDVDPSVRTLPWPPGRLGHQPPRPPSH